MVTAVLSGARINEEISRHVGQTKGVAEFAVKQQTTIGTDGRAAERQLHLAVELEPQRAGFRFTRRVTRRVTAKSLLLHG